MTDYDLADLQMHYVRYPPDYIDYLQQKIDMLMIALRGLKQPFPTTHEEICWCKQPRYNPQPGKCHSPRCEKAREALDYLYYGDNG